MSVLQVIGLVVGVLIALRLLAIVLFRVFGPSDERLKREARIVGDSNDPNAVSQWLRTGRLPK